MFSNSPAEVPDYAELGYPETTVRYPGMFPLDIWVDRLLCALLNAGLDWYWYPVTDKENQGDIENP